ncbi:plasmid stabilization protein [Methylocaldum sp.]|uniref:type II toxin-antitoxin system RelE/ParE family toxin n=1 Tax=Methylocaldum sp. TaxID=1969727 RepID=UPI002D2D24DC|nr:plasmid stabilization protein [Methylocaldum sp.]HYE36308.1 plasmid stabilization protein [Methylocaldum sp.]
MPYKLLFPASYQKRETAFLKRHPDLRERYYKTLMLLEQDPFHPSLRLHPLQGKLAGLHSASISMQYRITLELEVRGQEIILINVGSHGEIY